MERTGLTKEVPGMEELIRSKWDGGRVEKKKQGGDGHWRSRANSREKGGGFLKTERGFRRGLRLRVRKNRQGKRGKKAFALSKTTHGPGGEDHKKLLVNGEKGKYL